MSEIDGNLKALYEAEERYNAANESAQARLKSLNESIEKLKALINKPAAKYKVGDIVWRLNDEYEPESFTVSDIIFDSNCFLVIDEDTSLWSEEQVYKSREELVKAQIEYWISLSDEDNSPCSDVGCKHESDGKEIGLYYSGTSCEWKCRKCGEFY